MKRFIFVLLGLLVLPMLAIAQTAEPSVVTNSAKQVTGTRANLSGQLQLTTQAQENQYASFDGYFIYAINQNLAVCENDDDVRYLDLTSEGQFSTQLTGLDREQNYYFRACVRKTTNNQVYSGSLRSFLTDEIDYGPIQTDGNWSGNWAVNTSLEDGEEGAQGAGGWMCFQDGQEVECPEETINEIINSNSTGKCFKDGQQVACPAGLFDWSDEVRGPNSDGECYQGSTRISCPDPDGDGVSEVGLDGNCRVLNDSGVGGAVTECADDDGDGIVGPNDAGECYSAFGGRAASCPDNNSDSVNGTDGNQNNGVTPSGTGSGGQGNLSGPQIPNAPEVGDLGTDGISLGETGRDDTGLVPCNGPDCSISDIFLLVQRLINVGLAFVIVYVIVRFIMVGVSMLFNQTNANKLTEFRKKLLDMIIGIILVVAAWLIVNTVTNIFIDPEFSERQGGEVDLLDGGI